MHELAFAAVAGGWPVEVRGWFERSLFEDLAAAISAAPECPREPRAPRANDVIVLPAGHIEPAVYAGPWLSAGRLIVLALSPLGMLGWPFTAGWRRPSHLDLTPQQVNRPEYFAALAKMSIGLWTNSELTAARARAAGVQTAYLGEGRPEGYPPPPTQKPLDVVWVQNNRWGTVAEPLAARLTCSMASIGTVSHPEMLRRLGEARVLLYPGQVEGEPRLTREARAMGTVPVVVRGANPYSSRLSEDHGVVGADSLKAIPATIMRLLEEPEKWSALSSRAIATARSEGAWERYVRRVNDALEAEPEADPARPARGDMGAEVRSQLGETITALAQAGSRVSELEAELRRVNARNAEVELELLRLAQRKDEAEAELLGAHAELARLTSRRALRWPRPTSSALRRARTPTD
jgi:glycosyltransferase involved in cell wall biosynthesis